MPVSLTLIDEAASRISFMSMEEVRQRVAAADRILVIFMYASATPTTRVMCPAPATCHAGRSSCASTRSCPTRPRAFSLLRVRQALDPL